MRPARLPRGYSCILLGTIYYPPNDNDPAILDYLWQSLSSIESRFSYCSLVIVGDFNRLSTKRLQNSFDLRQIVNFPTRGDRTPDLVLTNLKEYYKDPIQRPPHGLSDHMSVEVQPKDRSQLFHSRLTIKTKVLKHSNRLAMRTYCQEVNTHTLVGNAHGCAEKVLIFQSIIQYGLDSVLPLRSKTIHSRDPPWVNPVLKDPISRRQRALAENNQPMFRFLRNRVNRERKNCRQRYYYSKVKECKPSAWWKEVKKLSGMSSALRDSDELMRSLQHISEESLSASDLANLINDTFLCPMQDFTPLSAETLQQLQDHSTALPFAVTAHAVYLQLASINPRKAPGPDGIPAWLLKENADLLSDTVTDIIKSSFAERRLPPSWKSADIVPIPKQKPIKDVNKHLRPISLTPVLSKVAEEFVVTDHLRPSVLKKIGDNQFGAIPESSTTHALISMVHQTWWTKHTDGTGSTVRVVLFDYRKDFDLIDHVLLAGKLLALDMPIGVSFWIIDFLADRTQRIKLGEDCLSEWRNVPAGVPQGTKLGPWLFILMIDDINTSNTELWKYVDDTTIAECVDRKEVSCIQSGVEELIAKTNQNKFQLNESKCKELRISFAKAAVDFASVVIKG